MSNLKTIRSVDEAREKGAKGGIKSGESRRRRAALKERIKIMLEMPCKNMEIKNQIASSLGLEVEDNFDVIISALYSKAMQGDVQAIKQIFEFGGMFTPESTINVKSIEDMTDEELREIRDRYGSEA